MSGLYDDLQPAVANPLAPAQTAIRFALARLDEFQKFGVRQFGSHYPPGFFDDLDLLVDDLTECHNHIGRLIDREINR